MKTVLVARVAKANGYSVVMDRQVAAQTRLIVHANSTADLTAAVIKALGLTGELPLAIEGPRWLFVGFSLAGLTDPDAARFVDKIGWARYA